MTAYRLVLALALFAEAGANSVLAQDASQVRGYAEISPHDVSLKEGPLAVELPYSEQALAKIQKLPEKWSLPSVAVETKLEVIALPVVTAAEAPNLSEADPIPATIQPEPASSREGLPEKSGNETALDSAGQPNTVDGEQSKAGGDGKKTIERQVRGVSAHTLDLGDITINSSLGEPLDAEIGLIATDKAVISRLSARLASPALFKSMGMKYPGKLPKLDFQIALRTDDAPYIKVVSAEPVRTSQIKLLVQLNGAADMLIRQYSISLSAGGAKNAAEKKPGVQFAQAEALPVQGGSPPLPPMELTQKVAPPEVAPSAKAEADNVISSPPEKQEIVSALQAKPEEAPPRSAELPEMANDAEPKKEVVGETAGAALVPLAEQKPDAGAAANNSIQDVSAQLRMKVAEPAEAAAEPKQIEPAQTSIELAGKTENAAMPEGDVQTKVAEASLHGEPESELMKGTKLDGEAKKESLHISMVDVAPQVEAADVEKPAARAGESNADLDGSELKLSESLGQGMPTQAGQAAGSEAPAEKPEIVAQTKTEQTSTVEKTPAEVSNAPTRAAGPLAEEGAKPVEGEVAKIAIPAKPAEASAEGKSLPVVKSHKNALFDAVQKAVLKSPDVLAKWETFHAVIKETDAARGGYFPRLDITASKGRELYGSPYITPVGMARKGASITLTQVLFDGFATRNEVKRLNQVQLLRYYELLDASETAALEAMRAYYDVVRMRKLFELTEENYVVHRKAYEHIMQKVKAGVGRRVDLEQASGRLALSKSNLTQDNANVHDASAKYQRIVGELPPPEMVSPESEAIQEKIDRLILPNAAAATLAVAVDSHPAILAAVENVRAAKFDMSQRWSKFQPTINLQVSRYNNTNYSGLAGVTRDATAEVVMTWNLFSGGADRARTKQYASLLEAARDQRDKTCRDIRMNLEIAYNDISKLREQLEYMDQHQVAIGKAVTAYQKQFEIGQRSLLDVLDSENELFQARRSYTGAQYDLYIAQARTVAGMGQLAGSLGLARLETPDVPELLGASSDGPETCLPEPALANTYSIDELNERAKDEMEAMKPRRSPSIEGELDDASVEPTVEPAKATPGGEDADSIMQELEKVGHADEKPAAGSSKPEN